ncbi:unnamed protein product [Closterium sp. NIES-53]
MYLMTCTRPDLAYPLSILARYVAPGRHRPEHMAAAKRVLRYLCSTSGMVLVLGGRRPVVLTGHADASWADDQTTQRSSQGYTFSLGSGSVSWRSTRSSSVLSSSCEAEIYARAMAAQELRWLTYLLTDLGEQPRSPPVLYQRGQLRLAYVASEANTADIFTKALAPGDHQRFCTMLVHSFLFLHSAGAAGAAGGGTGAVSASQFPLPPSSPLPGPSPYSGPTRGLTERREPESRPVSPVSRAASPVRTARASRVLRPCPPPVPGTHSMTLRCSTAPHRVPLPSPPASSLPDGPDPESDSLHATSPTVTRFLATAVTDPQFESTAASALVAELVDFAAECRLDYATSLVAESASAFVCPPSVGGECALGTDVLEDRQEEFECFAAAVPHLVSMLLALEGDPDAPDIPTPRSYAEAIEGTYVDEVPPPGANIASGMWIFRVKRLPGSSPVFKARYVARGFSQRQGVDFFQTFSPTPKMTTLRVLLHVAAQRDYELHSLYFSTTFLQGSLHKEISLRRPLGFTGTTLATLGFASSTADPSLFLRTDTTLPPFYVLVYVDDLVFATADIEALAHVKSELQKRHTCTDLGEQTSYLGLRITRDRVQRTITLTLSLMVQQVLQRFGFTYSSPQSTPLPTGHSLSAPPSDESVEPSGPYPELVGCLITSGMGLVLGGRARVVLTGHANASWVDDLATQRSSQGYTFSLGSGYVSWRSPRSSSVLIFSCEAEIYAGAMAAQELCWLTYLLTDFGEAPRSPPVLYVDNKAISGESSILVLVVAYRNSKTVKDNKLGHLYLTRHMDFQLCGFGAVFLLLHFIFDLVPLYFNNENIVPPLDFSNPEAWSKKHLFFALFDKEKSEMPYPTHNKWVTWAMNSAVWILSKVTHIFRRSYVTGISRPAIQMQAGFLQEPGDYYIGRSKTKVPPKVLKAIEEHIFPKAERWLIEAQEWNNEQDKEHMYYAAKSFLEALLAARMPIAEDLAIYYVHCEDHPFDGVSVCDCERHPYVQMSGLCKDKDFQKWALDVYTLDKYGIEMRTNPTMSRATVRCTSSRNFGIEINLHKEEGGKKEIQINHLEKQVESLEQEKSSMKAELEAKTEVFAQLQKAFDALKNTAATSAAANMGESKRVPQMATKEATPVPQQAQQATPSQQSVGSQLNQAFFDAVMWLWCNCETVRKAWLYWDGARPLNNGHSLRQAYKRGFAVKFCKFTPTPPPVTPEKEAQPKENPPTTNAIETKMRKMEAVMKAVEHFWIDDSSAATSTVIENLDSIVKGHSINMLSEGIVLKEDSGRQLTKKR